MVSKLALATLYLSAFALARPNNVRRQDDGLTDAPELPTETEAPGLPEESETSGLPDESATPGLPEESETPELPEPEIPGEGPGKSDKVVPESSV